MEIGMNKLAHAHCLGIVEFSACRECNGNAMEMLQPGFEFLAVRWRKFEELTSKLSDNLYSRVLLL